MIQAIKLGLVFTVFAVAWLGVWWIWDRGMAVLFVALKEAVK